jgi:hypothetical protein
MKAISVIEVIDAAYMSHKVQSPYEQRGGMMFVGPAGVMKTSLVRAGLGEHPAKLWLSDLNINSLNEVRDYLIAGTYHTIGFPDFEKIYQRRADTASNVEGVIKQLMEEGFSKFSHESPGGLTENIRVFIVSSMTYSFYLHKISAWNKNGFARRILWCGIKTDRDELWQAVRNDRLIELNGIVRKEMPLNPIPMNLEPKEIHMLEELICKQKETTPFVLLKKIYAVLKWKYEKKEPGRAKAIIQDFGECLKTGLAQVELPDQK